MEIPYHEGLLAEIESFFQVHYNGQTLKKTPRYLHLVVTTPLFRFKDDVECLVDQEKEVIVIRSASRLGYYDFNANSLRIKKLLDSIKS